MDGQDGRRGQFMWEPPETLRAWPVMFRAASEARKVTALPMSSGVCSRPRGMRSWTVCSKTSRGVMPGYFSVSRL